METRAPDWVTTECAEALWVDDTREGCEDPAELVEEHEEYLLIVLGFNLVGKPTKGIA